MALLLARFLFIVCPSLFPAAAADDDIAMVIVDDGHTMTWKEYHAGLFEEFDVVDRWRKAGGYEFWEQPPEFALENEPGFRSLRAYAYRVLPDGDLIKTGLLTVSGPTTYDAFVRDELKRRDQRFGSITAATAKGSRFRTTIRSPPREWRDEDGSRRRSRIRDLQIAYSDGLMAMGESHARPFDFPFGAGQRLLRAAHGKSWYLLYRPGRVPSGLRTRFLDEVEQATGVSFQQYDNESTAAYALRRAFGESYLQLFRSLLLDVDEAVAWTRWPRSDSEPFRARVTLRFRPGTELANLVAELKADHSLRPVPAQGLAGAVNVNISIPARFRPLLQAIVANSAFNEEPLGQSFNDAIETGRLLATLRVDDGADGRPVIFGGLKVKAGLADLRALSVVAGGRLNAAGQVETVFRASVFEQDFAEQRILTGADNNGVRFAAAPAGSLPPYTRSASLWERNRDRATPLIEFRVDLRPWLKTAPDSPARTLLQNLETAYLRYGVWASEQSRRALAREKFGDRARLAHRQLAYSDYESLVGRGNADGDWTAQIIVRASRDSLTADCRVGRDLHSYYVVRRHARWPAGTSPE